MKKTLHRVAASPETPAHHRAVIGVGSNIDPHRYIPLAREHIQRTHTLMAESDWVETEPIGDPHQPPYLNGVFYIETIWEREKLVVWLREVEVALGRRRGKDKYGPRTIDLDLVIWDGRVVHPDYHTRGFLRHAVDQVYPDPLIF